MKWISRAEWQARPPKSGSTIYTVPASERTAFVNHYDGGHAIILNDHDACYEHVRKTQRYHQDVNDWADIGYNTLGCPHGGIFEGRGLDKVGAHCPGFNRVGHGHQFMLGDDQPPTDAAKAAARELYELQTKRSGNTLRMMGHRDGYATECPGDHTQEWVEDGMPVPKTVAAPAPKEWDVMATKDEIRAVVREEIDAAFRADVIPSPMFKTNPTVARDSALRFAMEWALQARDRAGINPATLAAEIVKALPAGGTSQADVEAALRNVLGSLDT